MTSNNAPPKLFVSYSWSNQEYQYRVIEIATELRNHGIEVILDVWDLKPGQDAYAFMETMVSDDVTKVLMLCDESYVRKSDERRGGAGTEAQIISPQTYASHKQDKFVAVVMQRDDDHSPFLPIYYGGRIYFDLSSPANYAAEFEKIVRWVWERPLHQKPPLGERPTYLDEAIKPLLINTGIAHRAAVSALSANDERSAAIVGAYFDRLVDGFEVFRVRLSGENQTSFDEDVIESIGQFTHYRNEVIEIFTAFAKFAPTEEIGECVVRFLERMLPYLEAPSGSDYSYQEIEFDNYSFIIHEIFLYLLAILIQNERYELANKFLSQQYYWSNRHKQTKMHNFTVMRTYLRSFEFRKQRLRSNRTNIRADVLRERNNGTAVPFDAILTADFVAWFRAFDSENWFPETLVYLDRFGGAFEPFARAQSRRYFEKVKCLLAVATAEQLKTKAATVQPEFTNMRLAYSVSPQSLLGANAIATAP